MVLIATNNVLSPILANLFNYSSRLRVESEASLFLMMLSAYIMRKSYSFGVHLNDALRFYDDRHSFSIGSEWEHFEQLKGFFVAFDAHCGCRLS